jgi:chromosome segregation ATPase
VDRDFEVIAQELSELGEKISSLEERVAEVERVNARLEDAALSTARALGEVSRHWNAVYDAMRRSETPGSETSSERDRAASKRASPGVRLRIASLLRGNIRTRGRQLGQPGFIVLLG